MKIRNGFVSNSSSSSFVMVGYLLKDESCSRFFELAKKLDPTVTEDYTNAEELHDDLGWFEEICGDGCKVCTLAGCGDNGVQEGYTFIGEYVTYSCENASDFVLDADKVIEAVKPFESAFMPEERKLKVISGTRWS